MKRFWMPACCAVALGASACDTFYVVRGRVSSCADRRPIAGAILHLSDDRRGGFAKTAEDGSYTVALNEPEGDGPSKLTLAKVGYRTEEHQVANPHVEQNVCLKPDAR
jgi:hypothetical protein